MLKRCIALMLAGVMLTSCGGGSVLPPIGGTVSPPVSQQIQDDIAMVAAGIKKYCGYVAPIAEVAQLVGGAIPGVGMVSGLISQVCAAVTTQGIRRGLSMPVVVNGVELHGYFEPRQGVSHGVSHGVRHGVVYHHGVAYKYSLRRR
jgi:hypothetical protein